MQLVGGVCGWQKNWQVPFVVRCEEDPLLEPEEPLEPVQRLEPVVPLEPPFELGRGREALAPAEIG